MLFAGFRRLFGRGKILLNETSIHLQGGHAGSETVYHALKHKVIYRRWASGGEKFKPETLKVPRSVKTEAAVREYVTQCRPFWMMHM